MGVTPRGLAGRPEVEPGLGFYLDSFNELSRSRGAGMAGPLPLSFQDFAAFFAIYRIETVDERERLIAYFQALDATYLEEVSKRNATSATNTDS